MRNEPPPADDAPAYIAGSVPAEWFEGSPEVMVDRDEIMIIGRLPEPELAALAGGSGAGKGEVGAADRQAAREGRVAAFRESTREQRIQIARQLEQRYRRRVAWGVNIGDDRQLFTTYSVPVMTRLRRQERQVLDTLVDSGVARSRSEALAWCVALVGQHADDWLSQLRGAMQTVEDLRRRGPSAQ